MWAIKICISCILAVFFDGTIIGILTILLSLPPSFPSKPIVLTPVFSAKGINSKRFLLFQLVEISINTSPDFAKAKNCLLKTKSYP